jgi:hypothetical protein
MGACGCKRNITRPSLEAEKGKMKKYILTLIVFTFALIAISSRAYCLPMMQSLSESVHAVLEFIVVKSIQPLGWQITVLIILMVFKENIISLLRGISKIKAGGILLEREMQQQNAAPVEKIVPLQDATETATPATSGSHEIEDDRLLKDEIDRLKSYVIFERIHATIFGSQLMFLRLFRNTGIPLLGAEKFYTAQAQEKKFDQQITPFHNWIYFLRQWRLIENSNGDYFIVTKLGSDFLDYVLSRGLTFEKLF